MYMSLVAGAVVAACGTAAPIAGAAEHPALIVIARAGADAADRAAARSDAGVVLVERAASRIDVVKTKPGTSLAAAAAELRRDDAVSSVEVDRPIAVAGGDPFFSYQWALENNGSFLWNPDAVADADIDAPEAWVRSTGADVQVAVVDTGVQADHPDLGDAVVPGWDFWDNDADPSDEHGHGTHVAGIVAARAGNDLGIIGVAPNATVMPLRVLDATGKGRTSAEIAAFTYAAEAGVKVVNASFGSGSYSVGEDLVIRQHPETLFVVAAGNDGVDLDEHPSYPCSLNYENVLCVGASTVADGPAEFSNYGAANVDLFAPGEDVASTWITDSYVLDSGTSMAAPHVAGTAALVAAAYPTLTTAGLRAAILAGVDRPAKLAGLSSSGGRLNANGALSAAAALLEPRPVDPPTAPTPPPAEVLLGAQNPQPTKTVDPPATSTTEVLARMLGASVTGTPKTHGGTAALVLRLSRSTTVAVELQRRRCLSGRCRWQTQGRLVHNGGAGISRVLLRGRTPLAGRWRAVATASASSRRTVEFSVRR